MAELPYSFLITFGLLFAAEKARERLSWSPFVAALVYVIPAICLKVAVPVLGMFLVQGTVDWGRAGIDFSIGFGWHWCLQYVLTVVLLALLARYEDTIAAWMIIFITGFIILEYVM